VGVYRVNRGYYSPLSYLPGHDLIFGDVFVDNLGTSEATGGSVVTIFLFAGAIATLIGGWMADRWDRLMSIKVGFLLTMPALVGLLLSSSPWLAIVFVVLIGVALFLPFSVIIMLGQDYLPNRIGTASGVTVGLPMSVGGIFAPLIGTLADHTSLTFALSTLLGVAVLALGITALLKDPQHQP
ncbi:MAG TPA: MFS transporter, partial [Beutenbergiaceae bacterium]|nr:MFS transporter [Beutenbergiaceae bacterium]